MRRHLRDHLADGLLLSANNQEVLLFRVSNIQGETSSIRILPLPCSPDMCIAESPRATFNSLRVLIPSSFSYSKLFHIYDWRRSNYRTFSTTALLGSFLLALDFLHSFLVFKQTNKTAVFPNMSIYVFFSSPARSIPEFLESNHQFILPLTSRLKNRKREFLSRFRPTFNSLHVVSSCLSSTVALFF